MGFFSPLPQISLPSFGLWSQGLGTLANVQADETLHVTLDLTCRSQTFLPESLPTNAELGHSYNLGIVVCSVFPFLGITGEVVLSSAKLPYR